MTDHDLELYRSMLKERDDKIAEMEKMIRHITFTSEGGVYVSHREDVDLSRMHPILLDIHRNS